MRGAGATIVGWLIVAVIVYFFFGFLIGTLRAIVRFGLVIIVIGVLATLYFKLRDDD